jgi:hypothetical protein
VCELLAGSPGFCRAPVLADESYLVATTEYLALGGSGVFAPGDLGSQLIVRASLVDAVTDALAHAARCSESPELARGACRRAALAFSAAADGAGAEASCAELACIDEGAGAIRDGRIEIEAP